MCKLGEADPDTTTVISMLQQMCGSIDQSLRAQPKEKLPEYLGLSQNQPNKLPGASGTELMIIFTTYRLRH